MRNRSNLSGARAAAFSSRIMSDHSSLGQGG
jgi:hypothetical protein